LLWKTARIAAAHYQVGKNRQHPAHDPTLLRAAAAVYSQAMSVGNVARVIAVLAACVAAAGSASSTSSSSQNPPTAGPEGAGGPNGQGGAPPPQQMEADRALGLWRSTFGAVKIEADNSHGGLASGSVQGIWVYQRQGQEVVGYFSGNLRGNVLQFRWQEPNEPPLTGEGYLVFDVQGRQYSGRWWSDRRDRVGDWNGWRPPVTRGAQAGSDPGQYGGQSYGYTQPQPGPYRRPQPYQRQPYQQQPYQQQPYQQQPYQQQPYQQQPYQQPPPYQQQPNQQRQPPPQPQPQPTYYN
jgi:hypothetical protein